MWSRDACAVLLSKLSTERRIFQIQYLICRYLLLWTDFCKAFCQTGNFKPIVLFLFFTTSPYKNWPPFLPFLLRKYRGLINIIRSFSPPYFMKLYFPLFLHFLLKKIRGFNTFLYFRTKGMVEYTECLVFRQVRRLIFKREIDSSGCSKTFFKREHDSTG